MSISEYYGASFKVILWLYLPLLGNLFTIPQLTTSSVSFRQSVLHQEHLRSSRGSSTLHSQAFWSAVHTLTSSLLKSRSIPLFINLCFTTLSRCSSQDSLAFSLFLFWSPLSNNTFYVALTETLERAVFLCMSGNDSLCEFLLFSKWAFSFKCCSLSINATQF